MSISLYQNHAETDYDLTLAALSYAEQGVPVYPVYGVQDGRCQCGDPDCKHPGKHPLGRLAPRGMLDATTDLDRSRAWWAQAPNANIGTPTGEVCKRLIIDIDERSGGWETIDLLQEQHGQLPPTITTLTGGGGMHLHYAFPKGADIRSKAGLIGPGVDIRANGGSVILPPSVHASGKRYEWAHIVTDVSEAAPVSPGRAPIWLLTLTQSPAQSFPRIVPPDDLHRGMGTGNDPFPVRDTGGVIVSGQRNSELASKAGAMRRAGFTQDEILVALLKLNADRCNPALPEREVATIARSIARYDPGPMCTPQRPHQGFTPIRVSNGKVA